jgi:DNA-binding GntR family transcriptional regulator
MSSMSLAQKAYEHLQEGVLSGRLRSGAVISEAALAKELGISRTPVGEAIRQLVREGLVEQVPRYGTIVRSIDRGELTDLYEMREALESYAAAKAALTISVPMLERLQQFCDVMEAIGREMRENGAGELDEPSLRRFLAADMAFHMLIIEASGNRRMIEVVKNMRTVSRIFRMRRAPHQPEVVHSAYAFHMKILGALRARDAEGARRHMLEHIAAGKNETLSRLYPSRPAASEGGVLDDLPADLLQELEDIEQSRREGIAATGGGGLDGGDGEGSAGLGRDGALRRRGSRTSTSS